MAQTTDCTESTCEPCAYSAEHGWWGPLANRGNSHCPQCHRTWRSTTECHCVGCCRQFATERAFGLHRSGQPDSRVCMDPADVNWSNGKAKLARRDSVFGEVWSVNDERGVSWERDDS